MYLCIFIIVENIVVNKIILLNFVHANILLFTLKYVNIYICIFTNQFTKCFKIREFSNIFSFIHQSMVLRKQLSYCRHWNLICKIFRVPLIKPYLLHFIILMAIQGENLRLNLQPRKLVSKSLVKK